MYISETVKTAFFIENYIYKYPYNNTGNEAKRLPVFYKIQDIHEKNSFAI